MKYGLQITYPNKTTDFCTNKGVRMEFETLDAAQKELRRWLQCGWIPRRIKYSVQEIV